jgi:hypothetical protein
MTKFLLFSLARHGTEYFVNCMNAGENKNQVYMGGELLRKINRYQELAKCTSLDHITEILKLSKTCDKDTLQYFYDRFANLEMYAREKKINAIGFKIFPRQISFNIEKRDTIMLQKIIEYVDKIIILDRNNLEFMYSFAHTLKAKSFERSKDIRIILNDSEVQTIIDQVRTKYYFFENIKAISTKLNKSCIYLHYDDLGSVRDKISRVLSICLKDWIPFEKNNYNYNQFLDDNPCLINFINNNSIFFNKMSLQYSALSNINNEEYEYYI